MCVCIWEKDEDRTELVDDHGDKNYMARATCEHA